MGAFTACAFDSLRLGMVLFNSRGVEGWCPLSDDVQRVLWAMPDASAKTVAQVVADQPGFSVYNPQCSLNAFWNALAAAVAFALVDFNDVSSAHAH